jgi:hypothetical protein
MSLLLVALRSLSVTKQHPFSRYRHASNVAPAFGPASQPTLERAGIRTVANGASGAGVPGRPAVSGDDAPIRANRPSRPPNDPSALQGLGVGRAACRRLRQAASTPHPPSRLTLRGAAANPLEDQHRPGHQRQPAHKQRRSKPPRRQHHDHADPAAHGPQTPVRAAQHTPDGHQEPSRSTAHQPARAYCTRDRITTLLHDRGLLRDDRAADALVRDGDFGVRDTLSP